MYGCFFMFSKYVIYALLSTIFTWFVTALGGASVFFFKKINQKLMALVFGFGAGVMISASFFSLILPALELTEELNQVGWLVAGSGFLTGGLVILLIDLLIPKVMKNNYHSSFNRKLLLVLSITLHNIPEGLAIGVAFASAGLGIGGSIESAMMLAIGIGLQNFPEGMAVSIPLRAEGMGRIKSFIIGQASGIVEPISAIMGVLLIYLVRPILPFVLDLAAGAMIYVVAEELIPSGKTDKDNKLGTIGVMIGFALMMILDVALG